MATVVARWDFFFYLRRIWVSSFQHFPRESMLKSQIQLLRQFTVYRMHLLIDPGHRLSRIISLCIKFNQESGNEIFCLSKNLFLLCQILLKNQNLNCFWDFSRLEYLKNGRFDQFYWSSSGYLKMLSIWYFFMLF